MGMSDVGETLTTCLERWMVEITVISLEGEVEQVFFLIKMVKVERRFYDILWGRTIDRILDLLWKISKVAEVKNTPMEV